MAAYQLSVNGGVLRRADGAYIPGDVRNRDWQAYLTWAESHTADAATVPDPIISAADFFMRFTDPEKVAVQTACNAAPTLGVGLVNGLALGRINLNSSVLGSWLDGLVSAGAITSDRKTELMTPP